MQTKKREQAAQQKAAHDGPVFLPALARLGVPVLVFGTVFSVLSFALTALVSPDRFPVRVGDRVVRLADLQEEEAALRKKQGELLVAREKLLQNSDAPVLTQVGKLRAETDSLGALLLEIDAVRRRFITGDIDPISIPQVTYDGSTRTLTIGGQVTDPAGRSVSILSRFVDELRLIPSMQSDGKQTVSDPAEYVQRDRPEGGSVSDFSIRLSLNHD